MSESRKAHPGSALGELDNMPLKQLLRRIADGLGGARAVITSRYPVTDLANWRDRGYLQVDTDNLPVSSAIGILRNRGVRGADSALARLVDEFGAHALTLDHLAEILVTYFDGDPGRTRELPPIETVSVDAYTEKQGQRLARIFRFYESKLPREEGSDVLRILSCFRFPVGLATLEGLLVYGRSKQHIKQMEPLKQSQLRMVIYKLRARKLIYIDTADRNDRYLTHAAVRDYFLQTTS